MIAIDARELVRWVIGLFVYDLLRALWRGEEAPSSGYPATCAWCGARCRRADPPAPDEPGARSVWWCSRKCHVEHWTADTRVSAPDGMARPEAPR